MENDQTLNFDVVNKHVEANFKPELRTSFTADENGICKIYPVVKPILVLVTQVIFIPQTWREAVKILIGALDSICK
jgi:hypothetical protein